jgi:hypothetical protein
VLAYVPHNISKNCYKRNRDATRIRSFMATASCLHAFCAHDLDSNSISSLLWYLLDASTTPQRVRRCPHYIYRSIHRLWSRHHQKRDRRMNFLSVTLLWSNPVMSNSGDFQSPPSCQPCVPRTYNYPYMSSMPIPRANCMEPSYLFIIAMWINSRCSITSLFVIFSITITLVFFSIP